MVSSGPSLTRTAIASSAFATASSTPKAAVCAGSGEAQIVSDAREREQQDEDDLRVGGSPLHHVEI
jgi:hypothetical protein